MKGNVNCVKMHAEKYIKHLNIHQYEKELLQRKMYCFKRKCRYKFVSPV